MKRFGFLGIFLLCLMAFLSMGQAETLDSKKQDSLEKSFSSTQDVNEGMDIKKASKEFIRLFHTARKSGDNPADVSRAEAYLQDCCPDPDTAVNLLKASGFEVSSVSDSKKIVELNYHYKATRKKDYDEFVFAERKIGWTWSWRPWDLLGLYRVTLFIKNGQIDQVSANVLFQSI